MPAKSPSASTTNAAEDVDFLNIIGNLKSIESNIEEVNVSSALDDGLVDVYRTLPLPFVATMQPRPPLRNFIIAPISLSITTFLTIIRWSKFHAECKGTFRTLLKNVLQFISKHSYLKLVEAIVFVILFGLMILPNTIFQLI